MPNHSYSVLMPVYGKENPAFLRAAIDSMLAQTLPPDEFILVCDGPLTPGLDAAIAAYGALTVVRLPQNRGLAHALNEGLRHCTHPYVARMDSDDIALPGRMAMEMEAMREHSPAFLSGTVLEFGDDPAQITGRRALPKTADEIRDFARRRNPVNHPAALFRRDAVLEAGGYGDCPLFEDYQLWVKLLVRGETGYNLPEPVLKMRTGNGLYDRRGGRAYFQSVCRFERFKRALGFSTRRDYWFCLLVKGTVALLPGGLRAWIYRRFLRT